MAFPSKDLTDQILKSIATDIRVQILVGNKALQDMVFDEVTKRVIEKSNADFNTEFQKYLDELEAAGTFNPPVVPPVPPVVPPVPPPGGPPPAPPGGPPAPPPGGPPGTPPPGGPLPPPPGGGGGWENELKNELLQLQLASSSAVDGVHQWATNLNNVTAADRRIVDLVSALSSAAWGLANDLPTTEQEFLSFKGAIGTINESLSSIVQQIEMGNTEFVATGLSLENLRTQLQNTRHIIDAAVVDRQSAQVVVNQLGGERATAREERLEELVQAARGAGGRFIALPPAERREQANLRAEQIAFDNATNSVQKLTREIGFNVNNFQALNKVITSVARTAMIAEHEHNTNMGKFIPGYSKTANTVKDMNTILADKGIPLYTKFLGGILMAVDGLGKLSTALLTAIQTVYAFGKQNAMPFNQIAKFWLESIKASWDSIGSLYSFTDKDYRETVQAEQASVGGRLAPAETATYVTQATRMGVDSGDLFRTAWQSYGLLGRSLDSSRDGVIKIIDQFKSLGIVGPKALEYMKNNAQLIAIYGDRFYGKIADSAVKFTKMGVDLQNFRMLAENIVLDFGSFIDKTAELGATIPGLQLDVIGLTQTSMMEGPIALADELQRQLQASGKDFSELPYFQQIALKQAFSLDEATIAKLTGEPLEDIPLSTLEIDKSSNGFLANILQWLIDNGSRFTGLFSIFSMVADAIGSIASTLVGIWGLFKLGSIVKGIAALRTGASVVGAAEVAGAAGAAEVAGAAGAAEVAGAAGAAGAAARGGIGWKTGVGRIGMGLGFGVAALGAGALEDQQREEGNIKTANAAGIAKSALTGAAWGGSMFGLPGAAVGGTAGALIGVQRELDPTNKIGQENYNRAMTSHTQGGAISEAIRAIITLFGGKSRSVPQSQSGQPLPTSARQASIFDTVMTSPINTKVQQLPELVVTATRPLIPPEIKVVSPPVIYHDTLPQDTRPINPYTGKRIDVDSTGKPIALLDFSPVILEIKNLNASIKQMQFNVDVNLDGRRVGTGLASLGAGYAAHNI